MLIGCQLWAQNITKSPYSTIGLGEMQFGGSAALHGMGQLSQGIKMPSLLNNQNPASYSGLQNTVWDAAGLASAGNISSANTSGGVTNATFAYFSAGFRVSQKRGWGLSFGLMPFSGIGYKINRTIQTSTFTGTEQNSGQGGLSRVYLGTGFRLKRNLSLGVNGGYVFGQLTQTTLLTIPVQYNMYNLVENRDRYLKGFAFDIGMQYADTFTATNKKQVEKKYQYTFGLTVSPQSSLSATDNYNVRTLGVGVTNPSGSGKDTVANRSDVTGTAILPMIVKGGVFFQEINHWGIGVDLSYAAWQNYQAFGSSDSLKNTIGFNIGGFYKHNKTDVKSYFNRIEYRAGMRYDNGNVSVSGTNISTLGFSVGLGLPIDKALSKINISAEYLMRGTTENKQLREDYFRLVIGVSISDYQWFRRYKYD